MATGQKIFPLPPHLSPLISIMTELKASSKIMLVAVEPSADALGAALFRVLKKKYPQATYIGCGGPLMEAEGFKTAFDISAFSVMGFTDVAKVLPEAWRRSRQLAKICKEEKVDIAVFIDGWSFSRMSAKRIRQRAPQTKIVKYAAPQVWASRPQRTEFVKGHFDLVLTLLPFEPPLFEAVGVPSVFVGNPNFEAVAQTPRSGSAFRSKHHMGKAPLLAILPGSRKGEVTRLLPIFEKTVEAVLKAVPNLQPLIVTAPAVKEDVQTAIAGWSSSPVMVDADEKFDAFEAVDVALAASGTVTTELAITKTPMVVAYRVDPLTAYWAKKVIVTPYISIINVMAGKMIIPERLQEECDPDILSADIIRLLTYEDDRLYQLDAFELILPRLIREEATAEKAATEILQLL
ncbi:MAG: lipid-A-disaccharide synthase [Pseudomonadota bacterium]